MSLRERTRPGSGIIKPFAAIPSRLVFAEQLGGGAGRDNLNKLPRKF